MLTSLDPRAKTSAMRTQTQPSGPIATLTMMGVKRGIEVTCPAVAFYENTKGVADCVKDLHGVKHRPRIEAQFEKHVNTHIYKVFFCVNTFVSNDMFFCLFFCIAFK